MTKPLDISDIVVFFISDEHIDCYIIFDGPGGEIGHSWATGNIHFDDDENYRADPISGVYLLRVAVHEIGHVLSLQVITTNEQTTNICTEIEYHSENV